MITNVIPNEKANGDIDVWTNFALYRTRLDKIGVFFGRQRREPSIFRIHDQRGAQVPGERRLAFVQSELAEVVVHVGDGAWSRQFTFACRGLLFSLGLLVARSMHDVIVVCEPSLASASSDASGARFERLSIELAGVQAGVKESVRSAKLELTQAMSMVAGHVAETSSAYTKQLEDLTVRLEIERALQQGTPYGSLYLPEAHGGRLEVVRAIVTETIQHVIDSGESANQASTKLAAGDDQLKDGHFKQAFRLYSEAYKAAVALPPKPR
jgi:hypothetical protein